MTPGGGWLRLGLEPGLEDGLRLSSGLKNMAFPNIFLTLALEDVPGRQRGLLVVVVVVVVAAAAVVVSAAAGAMAGRGTGGGGGGGRRIGPSRLPW